MERSRSISLPFRGLSELCVHRHLLLRVRAVNGLSLLQSLTFDFPRSCLAPNYFLLDVILDVKSLETGFLSLLLLLPRILVVLANLQDVWGRHTQEQWLRCQ